MAFRRWRWYVRILCGLALLPPLLWLLVVLVAPTGWARRQIVARLESRSGRRVALDGVSVGLMGGIRLTNLQIGSPQGTTDPWLKAADIRLDFGLLRDARRPLPADAARGRRRRAARPPPRRRDDRAGRPDPARAGASDRRWTDPDARASRHRPAPSGHGRRSSTSRPGPGSNCRTSRARDTPKGRWPSSSSSAVPSMAASSGSRPGSTGPPRTSPRRPSSAPTTWRSTTG